MGIPRETPEGFELFRAFLWIEGGVLRRFLICFFFLEEQGQLEFVEDEGMKKIAVNPLIFMLLGVLLGIASKYGDLAYANSFFSWFGLLSSGLLFWLVLYTVILYLSESRTQAMQLITSLMLPMLLSYYVYSYWFADYLSMKVVRFWMVMCAASLLLACCVFGLRYRKGFRILFVIASLLAIGYDAIAVNGVDFAVMIPEILLSVLLLRFLNRTIADAQKG